MYLINYKTAVKKSAIHGYGVFAKQNIAKGEVIEECPFLKTHGDNSKNHKGITGYVFDFYGKASALVLGYGSLYNHSYKPSAYYEYHQRRNIYVFVASKKIKANEEIFISYGKRYWNSDNRKQPK